MGLGENSLLENKQILFTYKEQENDSIGRGQRLSQNINKIPTGSTRSWEGDIPRINKDERQVMATRVRRDHGKNGQSAG